MAEYIERKAARALIKNFGKGAISDGRMELDAVDDIILLASAVECLPAADVAPVVHGEWLLRHIGHGHYWECSVCHTNPCIYVTKDTNYCPNCGAKMDGEEQGDA